MAFTLDIRSDVRAVNAKLGILAQSIRDKAIARSLNETIAKGKTHMAKEITSEYRLTSAKVKERLIISRAKGTGGFGNLRLTAELRGMGKGRKKRAMNVIAFVYGRRPRPGKKGEPPLMVKIKRAGSPKPIKGAFIGNKGRTVFQRIGESRLPIKAVTTGDVPQMFNQRRINTLVRSTMQRDFAMTYERNARFYLARFNAR